MLLCKSAFVAESLMHLLGTHLNRSVQGVTASTAQAEGAFISAPRQRARQLPSIVAANRLPVCAG